jgi:hypothetical protein
MMAGLHVVVGMAAWAWAAPHLDFPAPDPVALALVIGGAVLPDIDHPCSWVGRRVRLISHPLAALIGHRGCTALYAGRGRLWPVDPLAGLRTRCRGPFGGRLSVASRSGPPDLQRPATRLAIAATLRDTALQDRICG